MPILTGLSGIREVSREAIFIIDADDIVTVLRKGKAATDAGDHGTINVWKDDDGFYRCEAMVHMRTVEKKVYSRISSAIKWTDKWVKKIN